MLTTLICALAVGGQAASPKWQKTFSDEFDGPKGAAPNANWWRHDLGGSGWGNNELESYTDGAANSFLDGEGHLVIEARKEETTGKDGIHRPYSSARILTRGKFSQQYGRFEARIKLPRGQGIWPAFWMLGDVHTGWPNCGEIDILEAIGPDQASAHGTIHGPGYSGGGGKTAELKFPHSLADDYHVYAVEWDPTAIKWFVDDTLYHTETPAKVQPNKWVYDAPFFIIMNLAVGGAWPGYPDSTTQFPQRMLVDYVRVYKRAD